MDVRRRGDDRKQSITVVATDRMRRQEGDSDEREAICVAERLTTFLRCGPAVVGLRIRVHSFTSSGCVHLF